MASRLLALALAASTLVPAAVMAAPASTTLLELGGATIELSDATLPTKGGAPQFAASVDVTSDSPAVAWAIAAASGKGGARDGSTLVVENGVARRRASFTAAVITEVKLDDLDANQNKKPFQIEFKWEAETVEFSKPSGKVAATQSKPAPRWDTSSFRVVGLPGADAMLSRVSLPRITIAADKARTIGDLVLVFEGADAETLHAQVKKIIKDGKLADEEYLDLSVELKDPSLPTRTGKIAMRGKLKSTSAQANKSGMATATAVFTVEAFDPAGLVLNHK